MLSKTDPTMLRGTFAPGAATARTSCARASAAVEIRTLAPRHVMAHNFERFDMRPPLAMPNSDDRHCAMLDVSLARLCLVPPAGKSATKSSHENWSLGIGQVERP